MKKILLLVGFTSLLLSACNVFQPDDAVTASDVTAEEMKVPANFDFNMARNISLSVSATDVSNNVLKRVPFTISYYDGSSNQKIFSGSTTEGGVYNDIFSIPTGIDTLIIETNYIGLPNLKKVVIKNQTNIPPIILGEENRLGFSGDRTVMNLPKTDGFIYDLDNPYDGNGVPLQMTSDILPPQTLDYLNALLPSGVSLPLRSPAYFQMNYPNATRVTQRGDVTVSFIHEGASYRNALGYVTYRDGQAPTTAAEFERKMHIVFPNTSYRGSGGGLRTGDKVNLGTFEAGTNIIWFVVPDGWNGSNVVNRGSNFPIMYSDQRFNVNNRRQTILVRDPTSGKTYIAFEDMRDGDDDFNDLVFIVNVGCSECLPACTNCTTPTPPSHRLSSGSLAFEDLFPHKGDYDLNDVVVDYTFDESLDNSGNITKIEGVFNLRAMGGVVHNGFGIHFPNVAASKVTSITGSNIENNSYIFLNSNGSEKAQSKATMIVFDDAMRFFGGATYVNTLPGQPRKEPIVFNTIIKFSTPVSRAELGNAPYNPFIIIGKLRGKELHLVDNVPTDLMNVGFLGAYDDNSNPATGRYYKTRNNMPFALHIPGTFKYPNERVPINQAHLKFKQWAESNGNVYADWYRNFTGYRDNSKIYQ
jgi:LruC domain-containing protein